MRSERGERRTSIVNNPASIDLMDRLIKSFGRNNWKYDHFWADQEREFYMTLDSPGGTKSFHYWDHGGSRYGSSVEISYWDQDRDQDHLIFVLTQEVLNGRGKRPKDIRFHVETAPFEEKYWFQSVNKGGIEYWPNGEMDPIHNIKGMPRKIDMDATAKAFIEQVIEGRFERPRLIRPKK